MSINTYQENRILSASPVELVQILYTAANRAVQNARYHLAAGDIALRSREITKAREILLELGASVDATKAPEFSERLLALYDYLQSRLVEANAQQKDAPLAEVINLLETLQDAWSQCSANQQLELAASR